MSIVVSNVTKKYGDQLALNKVSFEVKKGKLLDFSDQMGRGNQP